MKGMVAWDCSTVVPFQEKFDYGLIYLVCGCTLFMVCKISFLFHRGRDSSCNLKSRIIASIFTEFFSYFDTIIQ